MANQIQKHNAGMRKGEEKESPFKDFPYKSLAMMAGGTGAGFIGSYYLTDFIGKKVFDKDDANQVSKVMSDANGQPLAPADAEKAVNSKINQAKMVKVGSSIALNALGIFVYKKIPIKPLAIGLNLGFAGNTALRLVSLDPIKKKIDPKHTKIISILDGDISDDIDRQKDEHDKLYKQYVELKGQKEDLEKENEELKNGIVTVGSDEYNDSVRKDALALLGASDLYDQLSGNKYDELGSEKLYLASTYDELTGGNNEDQMFGNESEENTMLGSETEEVMGLI